jgi:hypothetical protein
MKIKWNQIMKGEIKKNQSKKVKKQKKKTNSN